MATATWSGECPRCNDLIERGDVVVRRHGKWIHAHCAPGGDDER